ncbi:MAG: hypothetical protein IM568_10590 [Flavobacterium sp.]|nr:hypothetical protein [Flavobacterium sp.]
MEELDLLKKAWKKDSHSLEQVTEVEIYKMLHKKSSSIVKWIFYISLIELSFGFILNIIMSFTKYDSESIELLKKWNLYYFHIAITVIVYIVVIYFIYRFYTMYRSISVVDTTKNLLESILKTRKVVKQYVIFNLVSLALVFAVVFSLGLYYGYMDIMLKKGITTPEISTKTILISIAIIVLFTSIVTFIFWLFYRLLYGILLRRLYSNYKELKKIDL